MAAAASPLPGLETVRDTRRAALMLQPLRLRILALAREPLSATELGRSLKLPRQLVNYHVKELARARLLRRAGRRRKGNLLEICYVAAAQAFLLAPELLGPLEPQPQLAADSFSAAYLLALTSRTQSEVIRAGREAAAQGKRLSTLSIHTQFRFENPAQREQFTRELTAAVASVVARHSSPWTGAGRPYRMMIAAHPIPPEKKS